ncbi:MAG: OadG family protein [Tetragenococcus sp.]|nr:OadG family protein [Tetragenococcus sp.]
MTNFTILDGLVLMVVAMATVFVVLLGLWGILAIVKKLVERQSTERPAPASNNQAEVTINQEKSSEEQAEDGTIPPEKVALIMSLLVDKSKRNNK